MATSNEHFNAKDIDTQIEQSLAQAQSNEPNAQLVADLRQLHQADAQADTQSLNYAWQHIRARSRSQRSLDNEGKVIPMHIPSSRTPDKTQGGPRQQRFASTRRAFTLIAAVLVAALVVGSLLTVLYRARSAQGGNVTLPHSTVIPKATNQPTQVHPGKVVYTHKEKDSIIIGLQWSPDGKHIALAGNDVRIWDATTGKNEVTYHPTGGGRTPVQNIAWAPDGSQRLAVATNNVQIIDANTGKALITGPNQSTAHIGNLLTSLLTPLTSHSAGTASITGLAWSPDGKYIASSLNDPISESQNPQDHPILIWDSKTGAVVKTLIGHTADAYHVVWSPDGKYLASFSQNWDETVRVWNAKTGQLVYTVHAVGYGTMNELAWSPDSQYLAVSMSVQIGNNTVGEIKNKYQVQIWQALTGKPVLTYTLHSPNDIVQYLAWSHDGTRIATVENETQTISSGSNKGQQIVVNNVEIWNPLTGKTLFTYQERSGDMRVVTWSPDDTLIATASMSVSTLPPDKKANNATINVKVWEAPAK
ncbi:WD40 repeat domain-containing protein [Ktedonobacter racemifer]|uniref:WD40 repeat, subgroup n=1 Tax=Ktedonobacter racemifer DSM 44963 TaxID=485913 RepID=D6TQM3_KTERA|nr:PD40 domain-containing protein [Ktedonobacter racemifer]EFH87690.1 WD40 repeat, subgroup [Ktedonobacter racemifer DSM 44963]